MKPFAIVARLVLCLVVLLGAGCLGTVVHLDKNAPGHAAVATPPPADLEVGEHVRPDDPGERVLAFMPEATFGAAYWVGEWSAVSSVQLAGFYGTRRTSHHEDELSLSDRRVAPEWLIGAAAGYDLLPAQPGSRRYTFSARLAEASGGLELGYAFEPEGQVHSAMLGSFVAGFARVVFFRLLLSSERGVGVELGLAVDYALTFVWSR